MIKKVPKLDFQFPILPYFRNGSLLCPLHYVVKFRGFAFTTMKKSVQALKFEFDWPIPNISGHSFTGSYSSSVDCRVIKS